MQRLNRTVLIQVQEYQRESMHSNQIVKPRTRHIQSHGNGPGILFEVRARRAEVTAPPGAEEMIVRDAPALY